METCKYCGRSGEHAENCPARQPEKAERDADTDFTNLDVLDDVLVDETDQRVPALKEWLKELGLSEEDYARFVAAQKLRRETHAGMDRALQERLAKDPHPTEDELSMGAFAERIEPQVRGAVMSLRKKGYDTVSSGFDSYDYQSTTFGQQYFADLAPDVREALEKLDVEIRPRTLSFRTEETDLEKIAEKWDAIADVLPDLGRPAPPTQHGQAKDFRKKYGPKPQ